MQPMPFKLAVKNEFKEPNGATSNGGTVNIDFADYLNTQNLPGQQVVRTFDEGETHRFEAKEQTYPAGSYYRGFNPYSQHDGGWVLPNFDRITNPVINQAVQAGPYTAKYRNRYQMQVNGNLTETGGTISDILPQQNIWQYEASAITAPAQITSGSNQYFFYKWSDGIITNQRTVSNPTGNQTFEAYYKGHFLTNANTNFETAGSHKFIRTGNGMLHLVYRSHHYIYNGHSIFYETSTDNGATWQLRYSGVGYGDPAIAALSSNRVIIVYPAGNNIAAVTYDLSTNTVLATSSVLHGEGVDSPVDVSIAITTNNKILVTWYNNYYDPEYYFLMGYYARYGTINSGGVISWLSDYSYEWDALTSATAAHAAIEIRIHSGDGLFHFSFDDVDASGNQQIYYCPLIYSGGKVQWYVYSPYNNCLSSSSGYQNNTNPSFIAIDGSEATRFTWIGQSGSVIRSLFKDPGYSRYWNFGNNVTSSSINKASNSYVIGWSTGYTQSYTNNSTLYQLGNMSSTGRYVQVGNSDVLSNMRAMGFNTASSPYTFNLSNPIGSQSQQKAAEENAVALGRGCVVSIKTPTKGNTMTDSTKVKQATDGYIQFAYTIDNVTVDGQAVKFIEIPQTVKPKNDAEVSSFLLTEPFAVSGNSSLKFDIDYSTVNSDNAPAVLKQNRFVKLKVELIDAKTGRVIGVLNNCDNSERQVAASSSRGLDIDCRGIPSKEVQLRVVVVTNADALFSVTDKVVRASDVLEKGELERAKVSFTGSAVVTSYALDQNYPNPFNPSTTISYALPNDGIVTLKIYDALGREVAILVNELKTTGRYTVTFDASGLASGVYLCKLVSQPVGGSRNDIFMAVKKLLFVK